MSGDSDSDVPTLNKKKAHATPPDVSIQKNNVDDRNHPSPDPPYTQRTNGAERATAPKAPNRRFALFLFRMHSQSTHSEENKPLRLTWRSRTGHLAITRTTKL